MRSCIRGYFYFILFHVFSVPANFDYARIYANLTYSMDYIQHNPRQVSGDK